MEVRLSTLKPGSKFKVLPVILGNVTYPGQAGTFLYATSARARVRLRSNKAGRKFKTGTGDTVQFAGLDTYDTDWAPDTLVEFDGMDPHYAEMSAKTKGMSTTSTNTTGTTNSETDKKETNTMATQPIATAASADPTTILNKWNFAVTQLQKTLKVDGPTSASQVVRDRIQAIYEEAVSLQVPLPAPGYEDPVFSDMEFAKGLSSTKAAPVEATPAPKKATKKAATPASVKGKDAVAARADAKKAKGKAPKAAKTPTEKTAKAAKAPKAAGEKKPRTKKAPQNPCHDGCGALVRGKFKQGHDATYKSLVLKVEREELKQSDLPKGMVGKDGEPLEFKKVKDGYRCTNSAAAIKRS